RGTGARRVRASTRKKGRGARKSRTAREQQPQTRVHELTRLLKARTRELAEALQQQAAAADVLKVISRSGFELQAVFDTLVNSAGRLCRGAPASLDLSDGSKFRIVATYGFPPGYKQHMDDHPIPHDRRSISGRAVVERRIIHGHDIRLDAEYMLVEAQR